MLLRQHRRRLDRQRRRGRQRCGCRRCEARGRVGLRRLNLDLGRFLQHCRAMACISWLGLRQSRTKRQDTGDGGRGMGRNVSCHIGRKRDRWSAQARHEGQSRIIFIITIIVLTIIIIIWQGENKMSPAERNELPTALWHWLREKINEMDARGRAGQGMAGNPHHATNKTRGSAPRGCMQGKSAQASLRPMPIPIPPSRIRAF